MDRLTFYLDNRSPAIVRQISTQTGVFDIITGQTFKLRVRDKWGTALVIDAAMTPDVAKDTLTYAPKVGDFDVEGIYRAWIQATVATGITQDTDEFEIVVFAHTPGEGVRVGAVWRACRALTPVAWDALKHYPDYGDPELQRIIELAKLRVFRSVVPVANEDSLDARLVDYIAKKVLVDNALPAVIDYWTNMLVSQSSRGNSEEVKSYPDRIRAVEGQIERFKASLVEQVGEVEEILGAATGTKRQGPILVGGGKSVTPSLEDLPLPGNIANGTPWPIHESSRDPFWP